MAPILCAFSLSKRCFRATCTSEQCVLRTACTTIRSEPDRCCPHIRPLATAVLTNAHEDLNQYISYILADIVLLDETFIQKLGLRCPYMHKDRQLFIWRSSFHLYLSYITLKRRIYFYYSDTKATNNDSKI